MAQQLFEVPAGHRLTVSAGANKLAHAEPIDALSAGVLVSSSKVFGPYGFARSFRVIDGTATVAADTTVTDSLVTTGTGAPTNAAQATASINPAGDDNALIFTAVEFGTIGNGLSVAYIDPGANDAALSVSVSDQAIKVSLATGEAGAITTTAAEIVAAITASPEASRLTTAAVNAADSGVGDDGSGVVTAISRTAFTGGTGTGIGRSYPGGLYIDATNGNVYRNGGTLAAPVWRLPGEFLTTYVPVANAVSITTNTAKDICTLALTAGEWDVSALVERSLTGVTATRYAASISLTADTVAPAGGGSGLGTTGTVTQFATFGTTVTGSFATVIPSTRLVITGATTLHLVVIDLFSAGTLTAFGSLRARRIF